MLIFLTGQQSSTIFYGAGGGGDFDELWMKQCYFLW